jgi:hypothetical protein
MLESTPGKPWGIEFKDLLDVEPNMKWRLVISLTLPWIETNLCKKADYSERPYGTK